MSECLFNAYCDHLVALGLSPTEADWEIYTLTKRWTHGSRQQYTDGAATPFILGMLADWRGLKLEVQTRLWSKRMLRRFAWEQKVFRLYRASFLGDFGQHVDKITLAPAIYCAVVPAHAAYYRRPEDYSGAVIVMALKLTKGK